MTKTATKTLRKERYYPHPREAVWVALTDPHAIAEWLMPNTFRPELGAEFTFQVDPMKLCGETKTICKVEAFEPPARMVWSWVGHRKNGKVMEPMRLEWTLAEEGGGTRLVLFQEGLECLPIHERFMMTTGWGYMMKRLVPKVLARVERGEGGAWAFTPGAIPLEKRCYKTETLGPEFVR